MGLKRGDGFHPLVSAKFPANASLGQLSLVTASQPLAAVEQLMERRRNAFTSVSGMRTTTWPTRRDILAD